MKKIFIFALAAAAMASCTNDDFLGEGQGQALEEGQNGAILFTTAGGQKTQKGTKRKANHVGADAAEMLNNNFVVAGFKGGEMNAISSVVTTTVFDHYNVAWAENTAETTASNTSDWEYVGKGKSVWNTGLDDEAKQTIKYWDYSAGQYDFIAFSYSDATCTKYESSFPTDGELAVSAVTPATATSSTGGAYKVYGNTEALKKFYIADLVTAYNPANSGLTQPTTKPVMGQEVKLTFRNITSKVRLAFYETVPGYSIKEVKFYQNGSKPYEVGGSASDPTTQPTLFTTSNNFYNKGTYTVYFPTVNKTTPASDYNKAHVAFAAEDDGSSSTFTTEAATLNYTRDQASTKLTGEKYLGETSSTATYAGTATAKDSKGAYTSVLPNETSSALTLRVDYTLVSNDGSKETITVHGATAVIPAQYAQWKSNYAYTYIFKISDKTNGTTQGLGVGPEGLTPITFDAVVIDDEEFEQETITTVETPSITTYSPGVQPTANDEYLPSKDVYVMVQNEATLKNDLNTKGQLYTVTASSNPNVPTTEANVMDALNMGSTEGVVTTGRNGIKLSTETTTYPATIPGVDGNDIKVTTNQVAKFTTGTSGTVYAYVYTVSDAADTEYYSAITVDANAEIPENTYYTMNPDGTYTVVAAGTNGDTPVIYYKKYTNNNTTYAVKVIKVQ